MAQRQGPQHGDTMQGTFLNSIDSSSAQREQGQVNQESQVGALNFGDISISKDRGPLQERKQKLEADTCTRKEQREMCHMGGKKQDGNHCKFGETWP